jgi:6,7-dimethyl-8-ribityllumazine synthase
MTERPPHLLVIDARFYVDIADRLYAGACAAMTAAGASHDRLSVPGVLEIPQALAMALKAGESGGTRHDGYVALGCVIRGETSHYDIVAGESARALMDLAVAHQLAFGNGILTVENRGQAELRAGERDKGGDAAAAALAMVAHRRRLGLA